VAICCFINGYRTAYNDEPSLIAARPTSCSCRISPAPQKRGR